MSPTDDGKHVLAIYQARRAALARVQAQELAAMTEKRARQIMDSLVAVEPPWRPRPDWSGLVEQQAFGARGQRR